MASPYLYLVRMDIAHDHEVDFNETYDREHAPNLAAVPGVRRVARYQNPSPTYPRYLAAYEIDGPHVVASDAWRAAGEAGRWPRQVRPYTMNRHLAMYEWIGCSRQLTHATPYIYWVMMDVEPHREAVFNELYDSEHVPLLLKVPGCVNVVRYRTEAPAEPRYLAAYEIERADLPTSPEWNETADTGRWKPEVRPYTHNKRFIMSERIWPKQG